MLKRAFARIFGDPSKMAKSFLEMGPEGHTAERFMPPDTVPEEVLSEGDPDHRHTYQPQGGPVEDIGEYYATFVTYYECDCGRKVVSRERGLI